MSLRVSLAVVCMSVVLGGVTQASAAELAGNDLRRALTGKTVYLNTRLGVPLPILYREDGTMVGRAGATLARYVGQDRDQGVWWVTGKHLCQQWHNWLDGQAYCFALQRKGRTIYWRRNDGRSGTATIVQ